MKRLIAAGERSVPVLTLAKLGNVALSMIWGFAVTYVFVRALPGDEFRAFLLLVAFNNFTVSAEFGFTNVIYARLRKHWLGGNGDFRLEEIGVLFVFLTALIAGAATLVGLLIAIGAIRTGLPGIFLIFFIASALNVMLLLAKRALAALDRNLLWEALDIGRRIMTLGLLLSVLAGFPLLASVTAQLTLNMIFAGLGMLLIHRGLGMRVRQWFAMRVGGGHVRRSYMHDIGASMGFAMSEITAYNGPYFVIAAVSHNPALLIIFDFAFKMIRAVATATRATIEGALPGMTRLWFARDHGGFAGGLRRAALVALGVAFCADILLVGVGQRIFDILYHGTAILSLTDLMLLCLLLPALALICVSVYVQGALGRFAEMLRLSLPLLAGSLITPLVASWMPLQSSDELFMELYALLFVVLAGVHVVAMRRLVP